MLNFDNFRVSIISSSSMSMVIHEPSVPKTEDIPPTVNSESLTNCLQTVPPPVAVRSAPATAIVDDISNMSLSSVNLHPKVFFLNYILNCNGSK